MAGLETAVALASHDEMQVEVIERGAASRKDHIHWDRTTYPGDEKTQRWRSDGWGVGGGLSERLGGRSLCYHGVLLGIEEQALAAWPEEWVSSLAGDHAGYARCVDDLEPEFPELREHDFSEAATRIGLKHVPQAAQLDGATGRLRAYSPLRRALRMEARNERLNISRGAVERLRRSGDHWAIDTHDADGKSETRDGFDVCILASSAIGNVQILGRTFGHDLETPITDHFSIGVLGRLPPGDELEEFRHPALWVGYLSRPQLAANLFVHEMKPMENGDRLVKVAAVAEQGAGPEDFSHLSVMIDEGRTSDTYVDTRISLRDRRRLGDVRDELASVIGQIAQGDLEDVTGAWGGFAVPPPRGGSEPGRNNAQWRGHDNALQTLIDQPGSGKIAFYDFPYGAFEHEACSHPVGGRGPLATTTDLELKELPGVHLIGPGCFPRMGAANPAITIIVMARALADRVRERYV
jgi:hypothetical protein